MRTEVGDRQVTRAVPCIRVSTEAQTTENQERELRQRAECLGVEVAAVYTDTASVARVFFAVRLS